MAQILHAPPNNGFSAFWKQTILDLAPFGNKRKIVIHIFQSSKKKIENRNSPLDAHVDRPSVRIKKSISVKNGFSAFWKQALHMFNSFPCLDQC